MRILALAQEGFGGFGGIARYDAAFVAALGRCERVDEVVVIARRGSGEGCPALCRQLGPFPSKTAFVAAVFATVVQERCYDLVWCGHINLAPLALAVARAVGCPWWLQLHGIDAWERPARLRAGAAEQADLVLAVSRYTRQRFLAWANVEPARVKVVPNTVEERFSPGPRSPALLARYGIGGRRVLLTVTRLSKHDRYKGVDRVLSLLPELKECVPDIAYLVVGDGDDRPRLERLARDLGVAGQVRFVGRVSDEELVDHYRLADLFVMPSRKEGFGIVFLEAMACGVPAVGLNVDGSVDPLALEPLGHAVAEPELASTIARLLADPPPRRVPERLVTFSANMFSARLRQLLATTSSGT